MLNERLADSTAQSPAALDAPGALRDVQAIAEEAGLSITRLTPAPAVVRDAETEWTVTLEFEAAYNDLVRFLQAVADEPRLLTVTALRLHSPGTAADGITVTGSCRVTAFVHRHATEAPGHADSTPDAATRTADTTRVAGERDRADRGPAMNVLFGCSAALVLLCALPSTIAAQQPTPFTSGPDIVTATRDPFVRAAAPVAQEASPPRAADPRRRIARCVD